MTQSVSKASALLEEHASHEVTLVFPLMDQGNSPAPTVFSDSRHQSLEEAIIKMKRDQFDPAFCQVLIHQANNSIQLDPRDVGMIIDHLTDRALDTK